MYHFGVRDPLAHGFDLRLAGADFTFRVEWLQESDCRVTHSCPPERTPAPIIDYLNRDYTSLRGMLLDRLSLVLPQWVDRNPADVGVMLVELFAYVGDHLASAQDAVAAEAYLGTARQRVSVARHARLLDYRMHEGAAARTWVVATVDRHADDVVVQAGREILLTRGRHRLPDTAPAETARRAERDPALHVGRPSVLPAARCHNRHPGRHDDRPGPACR